MMKGYALSVSAVAGVVLLLVPRADEQDADLYAMRFLPGERAAGSKPARLGEVVGVP